MERGEHTMTVTATLAIIGEIIALIGTIIPIIISIRKIANGTKCQLRSEILRIYYHNKDTGKIRQYEYENFIFLYEAYKALRGNSFIDKIYDEVTSWEIIT